jgi:hypothetical protein
MTPQKHMTYIAIFFYFFLSLTSSAQQKNSLKNSLGEGQETIGANLFILDNIENQTNSTNLYSQFSGGCIDYILLQVRICDGDSLFASGSYQYTSGVYFDTLTNIANCDSIIGTGLYVVPPIFIVQNTSICEGDSYSFDGNMLTIAGVYNTTLVSSDGCDSIVQLNLTVLSTSITTLSQNICQGDVYIFGGNDRTTSGIYRDTFLAFNGCDSIEVLDLTVFLTPLILIDSTICQGDNIVFGGNMLTQSGSYYSYLVSSEGCDSIIQLNLAVLPRSSTIVAVTMCQGDTYFFGGNNLTTMNLYTNVLVSSNGCDSIVELYLTVLPSSTTSLSQNICQGDVYFFGGNSLTASGVYRDTLLAFNSCDSIVILNLTVFLTSLTLIDSTICQGDNIVFGGNTLIQSGSYYNYLVSSEGCDSTIQLNLTLLPSSNTVVSMAICQGDSYLFGDNNLATSGLYHDTLVSSNGCDSSVQLNLTIVPNSSTTLLEVICQGDTYFFGGNNLTTMGFYTTTLASSNGCDSIVQLHLTVLPSSTTILSATICQGDSYFFGGNNLATSGVYKDTLVASNGCDSITELDLIVLPNSTTTLLESICEGDSIFLAGAYQAIAGTYQDILTNRQGCDSVVITQLIVNSINQIYQTISICGNDSIWLQHDYQKTGGIYQDTLFSQGSCYSILSTTLLIESVAALSIDTIICQGDSILLGNTYRHTSGVYEDILTNANGCPLVINTNLTVNVIRNINIFPNVQDTICIQSNPFSLNSLVNYENLEIVNNLFDPAFVHEGVYTLVGTYENHAGCSYTESKIVYVMDCVTPMSTTSRTLPYLTVYPSPSNGQFYIDLGVVNSDYYRLTTVDELGRVVHEEEFENLSKKPVIKQHSMDLSRFSEGIYYTRLMTDSKVLVQKVQVIRR